MNECTFIIFGMSGDLATRKLLPALFKLYAQGRLQKFVVVGAARDACTREAILERAYAYLQDADKALFERFAAQVHYYQLDVEDAVQFANLCHLVQKFEKKHELVGNRVIYCATAADYFCAITKHSAESGLACRVSKNSAVYHRLVYEKPFGRDLATAHEINACIAHFFDESQIYRIDHYLSKELLGNIALVRFTNCVFEPLWNNRYIDSVQIILSEQVSVGNRGAYYDRYGALCDVVQNHMLEIVALVGMEPPHKLTGEHIRAERASVLKSLAVIDVLKGQYNGYRQEQGVAANSTTETFVLLYLMINNRRWAGVPFYLKTGKNLARKETVIHIKFKQVDCLLAKNCPTDSNYLTIRVTPDATFSLNVNAKKPGFGNEITPVTMDFCHAQLFGAATPDSYEIIFDEIMRNEQAVSVRFDEIEYAWRTIDHARLFDAPVYAYKVGSAGPVEVALFERKHGMRWRS